MASDLGGYGSDLPREPSEQRRPEMTPEQRNKWWEALDREWTELDQQEREESIAAAAERGLTKEQWQDYQELGEEDSWQAGQIEQARYRLREGPPNYEGTRPLTDIEKQEYLEKYRAQENKALERFRTEPCEGPDNKPIDTERLRPWVGWRQGDPPIEPGPLDRRDSVVYRREDRRDWQDARTGLRGPDADPDPRLDAEQVRFRIEERTEQACEVMGAKAWSNSKLAGRMYEKLSDDLKEKFPDGVRFSYEGFPQFDRYAIKTVVLEEGFRGPSRRDDFKRANEIFGWRKEPRGTTWHHTEDGMTMLLVDEKLHGEVGHWGGVRAAKQSGLWEEGS